MYAIRSYYGENAGIHWHMITENKVHYIATDRQEQEIPWIKSSRTVRIIAPGSY